MEVLVAFLSQIISKVYHVSQGSAPDFIMSARATTITVPSIDHTSQLDILSFIADISLRFSSKWLI